MKKSVVVLFVLFGFICLWSMARADELDSVRSAIAEKGAAWEAGETSISVLTPAERRMRLGALEPVLTGDEPMLAQSDEAQVAGLAAKFDWRNNGGNFVTSVKDQGQCGSCWAFSTTAALESAILIGRGTPGLDLDLSEQTLVSCDAPGRGCKGWYINQAAGYVVSSGLPAEGCYPYTEGNGSCKAACGNWQTCCTFKASSWGWIGQGSVSASALKNALVSHGPVVAQFKVYSDFYYYRNGVYAYSGGYYEGDHAVLVTGYNDSTNSFNVKNSWGPGWGEGGYFRVAYSQVGSAITFGYYSVALVPQQQHQLKVKKAGNGVGSVSSPCLTCAGAACSRYYPSGTGVTVVAAPTGHQVFGGWTGCTSTSGTNGTNCYVTLNNAATVTATFLAPPAISVAPAPVAFGAIVSGLQKSLAVKIADIGTAGLVVSSVTITGKDSTSFVVTPSSCSAAVKNPCTLTVTFTPGNIGPKTATLVIGSNDPVTPTRKVALTGRGK